MLQGNNSSYFCTQLVGFGNSVAAAAVAFAFAIGHDEIVKHVETAPADAVGVMAEAFFHSLLALGCVAFVVDDWFGSRRIISRMRDQILGPRLALPRFGLDVAIGIMAYPLVMAAVRGSRAVGLIVAVCLVLGALWTWLCRSSLRKPHDEASSDQEVHTYEILTRVITSHLAGTLAIVLLYFFHFGNDFRTWIAPFGDGGKTASMWVFGFLVGYRFLFPWVWRGGVFVANRFSKQSAVRP